ncbi:MAG TPA: response regulator [Polyangiaceae bacterium]|nr:response regulator [Polyangiaceae bacterium]
MMGQQIDTPVGTPAVRAEQPATVLVCDDELRLGMLTAELLDGLGYKGIAVGSGGDALRTIAEASPNIGLLLLDVNLARDDGGNPGVSAYEILRQLSASKESVPVVLISGQPRQDAPRALTSHPNVVGYLEKPYAVEGLLNAVRAALA